MRVNWAILIFQDITDDLSLKPQMLNTAKRHHYIPEFWIKNWSGSDGFVERYQKHVGGNLDVLRKPPKSVGYWKNLYTFPPTMRQDVSLEELFFRPLDNHASTVFRKLQLDENPILCGAEAGTLAIFLMSLLHRSPSGLDVIVRASEKMLASIRVEMRGRYPELRGKNDPETVEEYESQQSPFADRETLMRQLPKIIANENIVKFLGGLHWVKINRIENENVPFLLLSDDPLIRTNGLKKTDGHVAFALTPETLVLGVYDADFKEYFLKQDCRTLFVNANVQAVSSARQFVVARDRSQSRFIQNRFGSRMRPMIGDQIFDNL